jgi:hypothetical protein
MDNLRPMKPSVSRPRWHGNQFLHDGVSRRVADQLGFRPAPDLIAAVASRRDGSIVQLPAGKMTPGFAACERVRLGRDGSFCQAATVFDMR